MEFCNKCGIGIIDHPSLYVYICSECGYSFQIDPSGKSPKITILRVGSQKLQKAYRERRKK